MATRVLDNPPSGTVADLVVGDTLEVLLTLFGRSGFVWAVTDSPSVVRLGGAVRPSDADRGSARRSGRAPVRTHSLRFVAVGEGLGRLTFSLAPEWDDRVRERIDVTVAVLPG